jgi:hypothetical protein
MDIRDPTFFESWRAAGAEERGELVYVLTLISAIVLLMAVSAATIGFFVALIGYPKAGVMVALLLFGIVIHSFFRP